MIILWNCHQIVDSRLAPLGVKSGRRGSYEVQYMNNKNPHPHAGVALKLPIEFEN